MDNTPAPMWRRYGREFIVAILTFALSAGIGFGTGLLDYSATMQESEFRRLERLTDRLEDRLDYYATRNVELYRERQQLRADIDSLGYVVAQLQWQNYKLTRQVDALEDQIKALGKVPVLPPEFNYQLDATPRKIDSGSASPFYVPYLPVLGNLL